MTFVDLEFVSRVYALWGRIPLVYDASNLVTYLGKERFLRKRVVSLLGVTRGASVLDLACGNGSNFPYLQRRVGPNGTLTGFDYSIEMLQAARARVAGAGWTNVRLRQGDAARLPFPDECFDGVVSTLGVSAIPEHEAALEHCRRVLKPGAAIVILDAKPFDGLLRVFNPLVKLAYAVGASWDYKKDVVGCLRSLFGDVFVERYNGGSMYVARAVKRG
ncbi:MAG: hypothetical protein Kow0069_04350 [Promethearchaeota archaeon]